MSKIKLIIFDLDGVLIEAKRIHYDALNKALGEKYSIEWNEHLSLYDGLKTNQKLEMLTERKGLPVSLYKEIWDSKQMYTLQELRNIKFNPELVTTMTMLANEEYKLAVCSNSIRKTILTALSKLGIIEFFDLILSNEDVKNSKPHPEIYWKAISTMGYLPEETLIVEDSPYGLLAASRSKSHIMRVGSPKEVTYINIHKYLNKEKMNITPKWKDDKLNVLIPMAGAGSRFEQAGYTFPKPLIDVRNKPMIQVVVENLNIDANYIYIVQKKHREKYNLDTLLNLITPGCKVVEVDGITEGAACTALLAKEFINNNNPLFSFGVARAVQNYVNFNIKNIIYKLKNMQMISNLLVIGKKVQYI
jgi:HAD superfamily hydrolase (TIGR01509 family)